MFIPRLRNVGGPSHSLVILAANSLVSGPLEFSMADSEESHSMMEKR